MSNTNNVVNAVNAAAYLSNHKADQVSWSAIKIIMHSTPGGGPARSINLSFPRSSKSSAMQIAILAVNSPLTAAVNVWEYESETDEEMTSQLSYRSPGFEFDAAAKALAS